MPITDTTSRQPRARWTTRAAAGGREQLVMQWRVSTRKRPPVVPH